MKYDYPMNGFYKYYCTNYLIEVVISIPSAHSNGQYQLRFQDISDMNKVPFIEREGIVGMFFGGIFYPLDSITYDGGKRLISVKKNKLNDKLKEFDKLGETDNNYIIKKGSV